MSLIRRNRSEARAFLPSGSGDPWAIPTNGSLAAVTTSGIPVTESTAMSLLSVHACVRLLSETVANLPFAAARQGQNGAYLDAPTQPMIVSDPFGGLTDNRLPKRREGLIQMMVSVLLRGNAFALVVSRDDLGRPNRLMVLHPDSVTVAFTAEGVRGYQVNRKDVPADDIIHILGTSYPGQAAGLSVIQAARNAIGLGLAAEMFGARFFGSGAHMTGIIEMEQDLDKEKARVMKEGFQSVHSGVVNSHTVGVLTGGAKWTPISVAPDDAQFLGTRAAQTLDIAMLFGIPPHMLGQVDKTTSWGTGIEQQAMGFLTFTLNSWLARFEEAWDAMLYSPRLYKQQVARFDVNALLRTDEAGRYAVYSAARAAAILTTNEIRARENLPPIDGGDQIDAPLNSNVKPMQDTQAGKSQPSKDALGAVL
jgi:HK97 family phage portal protein